MKTPEEWIRILYTNAMCLTNNNLAKNIISDIQTEAYNQAISDAAELADKVFPECDAFTILKLLK